MQAFSCPPPKLPPVHVRVCPGLNGTLTVRITDQGGGIAEEFIDKVRRQGAGWRLWGTQGC